jgi:hypothetical protein
MAIESRRDRHQGDAASVDAAGAGVGNPGLAEELGVEVVAPLDGTALHRADAGVQVSGTSPGEPVPQRSQAPHPAQTPKWVS